MAYKRKKIIISIFLVLFILTGCTNFSVQELMEQTEEHPNPIVTIEMDNGKQIKIELYPKVAPNTVNNFISLVKEGFYDGLTYHRVVQGFIIQGGDPLGNGTGGAGYEIEGEFTLNGFQNSLHHKKGTVSMARGEGLNSASSQFFITLDDMIPLDGEYAAFGQVIEGMDIVEKIADVSTDDNQCPLKKIIMKKVTVDTFGKSYPEPKLITVSHCMNIGDEDVEK